MLAMAWWKFARLDWLDIYCFDSYCWFRNLVLSLVWCSRDSLECMSKESQKEFSFWGLRVMCWFATQAILSMYFVLRLVVAIRLCTNHWTQNLVTGRSVCAKHFHEVTTYSVHLILTTDNSWIWLLNRSFHYACILYIFYIYAVDGRWVLLFPATSIQHHAPALQRWHTVCYFLSLILQHTAYLSIICYYLYSILFCLHICILGGWFPFRLIAAIHSAEFHFYSRLFSFLLLLRLHLPPSTSPPKPCPGEFSLVLFYRSLLRLLTCSIFHFPLFPFERVFSLALSLSPFSALLISALSTVCLSSFCMFEPCLFWLLIIPVCTVFLLISSSRLHALFFSLFSRPISLLSIRVLPSLWSRDPVLSLLWLLFSKAVLLSSLVLVLLFFSPFLLHHTPFQHAETTY